MMNAQIDPCVVLWQAMNEAEKVGNRTDDKLIVEFLRRAGYCIAPAPAPEATRSQRLSEAGYTRRPSWKSLPKDGEDDEPEATPAQAQQAEGVTLPPIPGHPEPHTHRWSKPEEAAIKAYGELCAIVALAATKAEAKRLTDEQIAFCIFEGRVESGPFKREGTTSFRIARATEAACAESWGVKLAGIEPKPRGWVCQKCGVDRCKEACPKGHTAALIGDCPMVAIGASKGGADA